MLINESGLVRCIKRAYKSAGYAVARRGRLHDDLHRTMVYPMQAGGHPTQGAGTCAKPPSAGSASFCRVDPAHFGRWRW